MSTYRNAAVDGTGGITSDTQDPFRPVEFGETGGSNANVAQQKVLALGDSLPVYKAGAGYTAGNADTTEIDSPVTDQSAPAGAGDTTDLSVTITVNDQGGVATAVVQTLPDANTYNSGDFLTVDGGTSGNLAQIYIP